MSKELYFYKVHRVNEQLPKVINIDETPLEYEHTDEDHASDWERSIGQRCLIKQRRIDIFAAAESIYGRMPKSMSYQYNGDYSCYDDEGELIGALTRKMMEPYYYIDERFSYVYAKESLISADSGYIVESTHSGIIDYDELIQWAEEATQYIDEYYSGECYKEPGQVLLAVMLASVHAKNGEMILCEVD